MIPSRSPAQQQKQNFSKNNIKKKKKFQLYTRKLLQISLEILFQCNIPSMHYIALTTINRIYDIYVYHNLFNPGFYHSCYIPPSRRICSQSQASHSPVNKNETENQNKLLVPSPIATTVSFSVNNQQNCVPNDQTSKLNAEY